MGLGPAAHALKIEKGTAAADDDDDDGDDDHGANDDVHKEDISL